MNEPAKAVQGSPNEKGANAPQDKPADKPTTTQPRAQDRVKEQGSHAAEKTLMDHLGIPADVQNQIKPKVVQSMDGDLPASHPKEPASPPSQEPPKPEAQPDQPAKARKDEDDDDDDDDEEIERAAAPDEAPTAEAQTQQPVDKKQKRINRLTRKTYKLEGELDQLTAQNRELQEKLGKAEGKSEKTTVPSKSGFLPNVTSESQLDQEVERARALILWCNENPEGSRQDDGEFVTAKDVAKWKSNAEMVILGSAPRRLELREHVAKEAEFKTLSGKYDALAKQAWPEIFDSKTEDYQLAKTVLAQNPELKTRPDKNYALGLLVEGMKSLHGRVQAAAKEVARENGNGQHRDISERAFEPRVPLAPAGPEAPAAREVVPSSHKQMNEAMKELVADPDGSVSSLAKVFSVLRQTEKRADNRAAVTV